MDRRAAAVLLSLVAAGIAADACVRVPYTGRRTFVLIGFDQELQLGTEAYAEILKSEKVIAAGTHAGIVADVAKGVSRATPSQFRELPWEWKLLDSDMVNAFALPGGKIAVYRGILPVLKTEGGLGAVLGHEAGHVVARHGAERMTGTLMLQMGLALADVSLQNSEAHDVLLGLLGLGAVVGVQLPFSRANELESDYLGGIFMAKAGYDPNEAWRVWERMNDAGSRNDFALFSTHPSNAKRIERLKEEQPTFGKHYAKAKKKKGAGREL
jgi:predicted Zn-dependent protease